MRGYRLVSKRVDRCVSDPVALAIHRCVVCSKRIPVDDARTHKYCGQRCIQRAARLRARGLEPDGKWVSAKLNPKSKHSRAVSA